jgi:hypothetical protein
MRNRGGIILVIGIAGFIYCSVRAADLPPLDPGLSISEILATPRGRWEALRDASVFVGACGAVLAVFGRGR